MTSSDPPASASQRARITGVSHRAQPPMTFSSLCALEYPSQITISYESSIMFLVYDDLHPLNLY
uniref:Uncharacterized protein n=1 Tax=Prolemur simus TaxID=1328070 RepID=A0A8C8ZKG5_PROSS